MLAATVVCAAVFYVAPWAPLYLLALLALAALTWWRLDLALPVVLLFAPFFMQPKLIGLSLPIGNHHLRLKEISPAEALLLLDVAVGVLQTILPGWRGRFDWGKIRRSPFLWPALAFLIAGTVSTAAAAYRHDAVQWYRWLFPEPLAYFALLLATRGAATRILLALAIIGSAMVAGVIALWDFWSPLGSSARIADTGEGGCQPVYGRGPEISCGPARAHAPYGSGDNLGLLYDRAVLLWLSLCLLARDHRRWWPLGILLLPVLVFTYSRGAWIAVVVAALLVIALVFPWGRWLALGLLVLAIVVAAAGGAYVVHAFQAGHAGTIQQRLRIWKSAGAIIRDNPVVGIGPDNFIHYFAPTREENHWQHQCTPGRGYIQPGAGSEPCLSHPHNEVLDLWLSSGLLGLLAFVWLQIVFWRQAAPSLRLRAGRDRDVLVLGAAGAMVAALLHGLVDQSYFLPDLALIFWALCVIVTPPVPAAPSPSTS